MKRFLVLVCIISLFLAGVPFAYSGTITETGMSQRDLVRFLSNVVTIVNELKADYNLAKAQLRTYALSNATLTALWEATAYTSGTLTYVIDGKLYSLSASSDIYITPTAAQSTPTYCNYLFSIDADGAITVTKGTEAAATASLTLPAVPANTAPFGYAQIYASSTAFTMGASSLSLAVLPSSPTWVNITMVDSGTSAATAVSASDLSLVNP